MNKIYYGEITIFYKQEAEEYLFLVVQNKRTQSISFVSGAQESFENSLFETAQREIKEELDLNSDQYELEEIPVKHKFIFGPQKKERTGSQGSYQVFISNLTGKNLNIICTEELEKATWMTEKEILNTLSFPDLKEVFHEVVKILKPSV